MSGRIAFNHVGQCVADLERAKRFYIDLFGFTLERELNPSDKLSAPLLGLEPPLGMTASYLTRDGLVLELIHFAAPAASRRVPAACSRRARSDPHLFERRRLRRRPRTDTRLRR